MQLIKFETENLEQIERRVVNKIETDDQALRYKEAIALLDAEKSAADAIKMKFYLEHKAVIDAAEELKSAHRAHIQKIDALKRAIKSKIIEYQNSKKNIAVRQIAAQSIDDIIQSAFSPENLKYNLTIQTEEPPIVKTRKIWDYGVTDWPKFLEWCIKRVPDLITISNKTKLIETIKKHRSETVDFVDIFEIEV